LAVGFSKVEEADKKKKEVGQAGFWKIRFSKIPPDRKSGII
jgi:hypothetical protein